MADIFTEVDEELRQEKLHALWHKNRFFVYGVIVCLVLGTAVGSVWKTWNRGQNVEATDALFALQDRVADGNLSEADTEAFGRAGHRALALLMTAGMSAEQGDFESARKYYQKLSEDSSVAAVFRDLARLQLASLDLDAGTANAQDILTRLEPLLSHDEGPWQSEARVIAALAKAHIDQDYAAAVDYLNEVLGVVTLPETLKARAQSLKDLYGKKISPAVEAPQPSREEG